VDIADAPNVDIVGDAVEVLPTLPKCDIVVTTEVFEHTAAWPQMIAVMADILRPSGWLVVTCAGTGRPAHSADGGWELKPNEHYANVSLDELRECCEANGIVMVRGEEGPPGDTRFIGQRL
jgi:predicted TPR repeat methyltransferase